MGVITDNTTSNITFAKLVEEWGNTQAISFNATENHLRCFAHVINLSVQEALHELEEKLNQINFYCICFYLIFIYLFIILYI